MTLRIIMKQAATGSEDGVSVRSFEKGWEGDVEESLAIVFVEQMEVAKYVVQTEKVGPEKTQNITKVNTPEKTDKNTEEKSPVITPKKAAAKTGRARSRRKSTRKAKK